MILTELRHLNGILRSGIQTLLEMSFMGSSEFCPVVVFYSPKRLPSILVKSDSGRYDVLFLKSDKMAIVVHALVAKHQGSFDQALSKAKDLDIVKSYKGNLTDQQLIDLLMVKNGMPRGLFANSFPKIEIVATEQQKVGHFSVHGMTDKNRKKIEPILDKASALLQKAGFGHLLYGDVFVVGRGAISQSTGADYEAKHDNIRLKLPLSSFEQEVRSFIHELGHRQEAKFKTDKNALNIRFTQARSKTPVLHIGDKVKSPEGREFNVTNLKYTNHGLQYQGHYTDEPDKSLIGSEAISYWDKADGTQDHRDVLAVSKYSMTDPSEFFAEVFAVAILGNETALQWIKEVSSK